MRWPRNAALTRTGTEDHVWLALIKRAVAGAPTLVQFKHGFVGDTACLGTAGQRNRPTSVLVSTDRAGQRLGGKRRPGCQRATSPGRLT